MLFINILRLFFDEIENVEDSRIHKQPTHFSKPVRYLCFGDKQSCYTFTA